MEGGRGALGRRIGTENEQGMKERERESEREKKLGGKMKK